MEYKMSDIGYQYRAITDADRVDPSEGPARYAGIVRLVSGEFGSLTGQVVNLDGLQLGTHAYPTYRDALLAEIASLQFGPDATASNVLARYVELYGDA